MSAAQQLRIGIITVSDRASRGGYEDRSGPAINAYLKSRLSCVWLAETKLVSDDRSAISLAIADLCDKKSCSIVFSTGGTGPTPRDVTPEATMDVCEKLLPGFGERMRAASVEHVPTAILSRQQAGIRGQTLIVNLPGNPKAIAECLDAVFPAIAHCTRLLGHAFPHSGDSTPISCDCG